MADNKEVVVRVRMPKETKEKIIKLAAERGRNLSEYGREAMTNELQNQQVMDAIKQLTKIMEGCLRASLGANVALPTFVNLENNNSVSTEDNLKDEIQTTSHNLFATFMNKHMGGVSECGYDLDIKKSKVKEK